MQRLLQGLEHGKLFLIPIVLQALCMAVDEFYFHKRRIFPLWEILGHPLYTTTVLACVVFTLVTVPTFINGVWFGLLGIFSCIFVTKDEWVHKKYCRPSEHWLHALLFVLHPLLLVSVAWCWWQGDLMGPVLWAFAVSLACFFVYQIMCIVFYKSFLKRNKAFQR